MYPHYSYESRTDRIASRGLMSARVSTARRWAGGYWWCVKHSDPITSPIALSISTFRSSSIFPRSHARGPEPPVWQEIKTPRRGFFSADSTEEIDRGILSHGGGHRSCIFNAPRRVASAIWYRRETTSADERANKGWSLYFRCWIHKIEKDRYNTKCHSVTTQRVPRCKTVKSREWSVHGWS